jgi:hypothetical protein
LHGLGLGVTRAWERRRGVVHASPWGKALGTLITFHYVCLAWIFFRAPTFKQALLVIKQIATLTTFHPNLPATVAILLAVGLASHYTPRAAYARAQRLFTELPAPAQGAVLFAVGVVLHEAASTAQVPFVYFQF